MGEVSRETGIIYDFKVYSLLNCKSGFATYGNEEDCGGRDVGTKQEGDQESSWGPSDIQLETWRRQLDIHIWNLGERSQLEIEKWELSVHHKY